jgi:hypothetical protein
MPTGRLILVAMTLKYRRRPLTGARRRVLGAEALPVIEVTPQLWEAFAAWDVPDPESGAGLAAAVERCRRLGGNRSAQGPGDVFGVADQRGSAVRNRL